MLQNILEQEDFIKGLPDEALYRAMEQPSGQPPQFLVLSEIQRRTDMRERYAATQEQPQGTISDQIISEGLGGMSPMGAPPQAMGSPVPTDSNFQPLPVVAAAGVPPPPTGGMALGSSGLAGMGGQPPGMSSGGIVGMSNGGGTAYIDPVTGQRMPMLQRFGTSLGAVLNPIESLFETAGGYTDAGFRRMAKSSRIRKIMEENPSLTEEEAEAIYEDMMLRTGRQPLPQFTGPFESEVVAREQVDSPGVLSESVSGADVDPDSGASLQGFTLPWASSENVFDVAGLPQTSGTDGAAITDGPDETDYERLMRELDSYVPTDSRIRGDQTAPSTFTPPVVHHGDKYLDRVMDRYGDIRTGAEGRLDTRRTQSQDLIEQIREEGRRDAFSAAMMQLGAGVAGGDMAAGLQRAGEAATSINALARDAARAEGRGLRDYEESTLSMIDQLGMQEAEFEYGEQKEEAVRVQEQARWDAEHGIREQSLQLERQWRDAGLEIQYATLKSNQRLKVTEIVAKAKSDVATTRRAAMNLFGEYMGDIQDIAGDMPPGTTQDEYMALINGMQTQILQALEVELGRDFFNAFRKEAEAGGGSEGEITAEEWLKRNN